MKKCGLIIRVSTDRQARNKEGSLKNQLQRLQAHIEYKNNVIGKEKWIEAEKYVLEGISGKDSFRSRQFGKLFEDLRSEKINTIICTALDRVCRSVKDFLNFFEILQEYQIEFVCLKQDYDTTSSRGKLFITIMMALAEFERETTSERTKDAIFARAERGLWNGGRIFGYDLDPDKKGNIIPNDKEKVIVNFAFDTYLRNGSIHATVRAMNENGFRTKQYESRYERSHPAREFTYSTIQHVLTNFAYIGKKEVNKKKRTQDQEKLPEEERYKIGDAVWEPIIDEEKFFRVQDLLNKNNASGHNETKTIKHTYILNSGLLWCDECGQEMEGRSGTGRKGIRYYYYICKNKECKFKIPADEIENLILDRIKELATHEDIVTDLIKTTNDRLQTNLPQLWERKELLEKELIEIKNSANVLLDKLPSMSDANSVFFEEKLSQLSKRREEIETGIETVESMIQETGKKAMSKETIIRVLSKFSDNFTRLQPYQQKEMIQAVIHKIMVSSDEIKIGLYGQTSDIALSRIYAPEKNSQVPTQLPDHATQRTNSDKSVAETIPCFYRFNNKMKALCRGEKADSIPKDKIMTQREWNSYLNQAENKNPILEGFRYLECLEESPGSTYKNVASKFNISKARVSQMIALVTKLHRKDN